MNDRLRRIIEELIDDVLDEMTTTGAAPGYETPKAFGKGNDADDDILVRKFGFSSAQNKKGNTKRVRESTETADAPGVGGYAAFNERSWDNVNAQLGYELVQRITEEELNRFVEDMFRKGSTLNEELDREDYIEIRKLIRAELAALFYDLFKKRNVWL